MMMGWLQPGTRRGTLAQMIGSRKTVPPRMLRIVPLGDRHIFFRLNSVTRSSSGVSGALAVPDKTATEPIGDDVEPGF